MTKKEISQAKDIQALRELYKKYNPKGLEWKQERWIGFIINSRKKRGYNV